MAAKSTTIAINIVAHTGKLLAPIKRAKAAVRGLTGAVGKMGAMLKAKTIAPLAAVAAGFLSVGYAIAKVKQQFDVIDLIAKTADKLGMTTEELIGLRHAAQMGGMSVTQFDMSVQRMTRRVSEAALGSGEARAAIKELGLDAQKMNMAGPAKSLEMIADALENVESPADRVRLAFKFFDSEGVNMVNVLGAGSEALKQAQQDAEKLGITLNRQDASKVEMMNDSMHRLREMITGVARRIAVELAPFIKWLADSFVNAGTEGEGMAGKVRAGVDMMIGVIGFALDALDLLRTGFARVQLFAQQAISGLVTGMALVVKAVEWAAEKIATGFTWAFARAQQAMTEAISYIITKLADFLTWIDSKLPERFKTGAGKMATEFAAAFEDIAQANRTAMEEKSYTVDFSFGDAPMEFARQMDAEVKAAEAEYRTFAGREKLSDKLKRNVERIRAEADAAAKKAAETPEMEMAGAAGKDLTSAAITRGSQAAFKAIKGTQDTEKAMLAEQQKQTRHLQNMERRGVVLAGANL